MKDIYVVGKKGPEMVEHRPNAKVVSFLNGQSLVNLKSLWRHYVGQQPLTAVLAKAKADIANDSVQF